MSQHWDSDGQAWIMPVLYELEQDGGVAGAESWTDLRDEVERKLTDLGAGDYAATLVQPLEDAVAGGSDFRALVGELATEYAGSTADAGAVGQVPLSDQSEQVDDFVAYLPSGEELAGVLIEEVLAELRELVSANPSDVATIGAEELGRWVSEDLESALREIAEVGWAS